ncbi:MAG: putative Type IV secretory pathway VirD4 component [Parcubacteria bacterium C7867-005]|nr:MAG: putative Type IV secretory pathway VirD4 component [Parcubacteria bacterium C7867-005]
MQSERGSFNNPHEEIEYLRSKVLEQERRFDRLGQSKERDAVIREFIQNFHREESKSLSQTTERESELHAGDLLKKNEDKQLHEMMHITETKGVLHALTVVEKMNGWCLEDDFHDFLVGLVREGLPPKGVKEKGPLYRALNMTLFEVVLPDNSIGTDQANQNKDLKTLISSMEQFYAGMLSVSEKETMGKNYFVLEMANSNGSEEFIFYASVPTEKKMLFEKQLLSIFPTARLIERQKDYNIFSDESYSLASVAELSASSALPLKTYESFDHDPLNTILNSFSKIPKDGSGAAIQIIFNPKGDQYIKKYQYIQKQIEKGVKPKDALTERSIFGDVIHTLGDLFAPSKKKKEEDKVNPNNTEVIDRIKTKLLAPTVSTNIRIAVSSNTKPEAERILSDIESSFNQFEVPGVNKIKFNRVKPKAFANFFRNFSFRLFASEEILPLNLKELTSVFHFHTTALQGRSELKQVKAVGAPAPIGLPTSGTLLGINRFSNTETKVYMTPEDRLRHFYTIGQTGTGKSTLLKNMIIQDILRGDGVCMIDPHGVDIVDVLANIPKERMDDVVYFDPASVERPMALNMLEYDRSKPEQKTFVVNELFSIFQKLYGAVPESLGPMFEQYFRNATMLVIEDPSSGSTLLDVSRVMVNKEFRQMKISKCQNPVVVQFWKDIAEKAGGEGSLANIVPYITSKFDVFLANDIMRPIIAQEKSSFDFRDIMDNKKILLVNLSKGRLGELNANLIGLILVGKILMAALSRADSMNTNLPPFYLYIDEFQNVTTNSIATILSEARKYKLSLTMAHQFIAQLEEEIKDAVFGNVGSIASFRVGADDSEYLEKQFAPTFGAKDLRDIDNRNAYLKMLVDGRPTKPFSIETIATPEGNREQVELLKKISFEKYGGDRGVIEKGIMDRYIKPAQPAV